MKKFVQCFRSDNSTVGQKAVLNAAPASHKSFPDAISEGYGVIWILKSLKH